MHCEQVIFVHRAMFCWEDQTNLERRITTQIWYCFTTVMSKRNYAPLEANWSGEKSPNCSFTDFFCQRMPGLDWTQWKVETNLELEPTAATIVKIFSWCINSPISAVDHLAFLTYSQHFLARRFFQNFPLPLTEDYKATPFLIVHLSLSLSHLTQDQLI